MSIPQRITVEQFWEMPQDECRMELVRGAVVSMSWPGAEHGILAATVLLELGNHVRAGDLGAVFPDCGFLLARQPDLVRRADVAFVAGARLPDPIPKRWLAMAPDLVVEVVSPTDRHIQIQEKIGEWLTHGSQVVLLVDPTSRSVTVHRSPTDVEVLHIGDTFAAGSVVPGWRLAIADLFPA